MERPLVEQTKTLYPRRPSERTVASAERCSPSLIKIERDNSAPPRPFIETRVHDVHISPMIAHSFAKRLARATGLYHSAHSISTRSTPQSRKELLYRPRADRH